MAPREKTILAMARPKRFRPTAWTRPLFLRGERITNYPMSLTQTLLNQRPGQHLAFLPNPRPEAIAETLTALANAEGGTLVLGMGPDGNLGDLYVVEEA